MGRAGRRKESRSITSASRGRAGEGGTRGSPEDEKDRSLQKFACAQAHRAMTDETNKASAQTGVPESFPPELLAQPVGARLEYFEQRCLISHPRLQEALETILQSICPPGEGASTRRPGTMVLVMGPSRVRKTTLIRLLEGRLLTKNRAFMASDPR